MHVGIYYTHPTLAPQAKQLAGLLNLPLLITPDGVDYVLELTPERLQLRSRQLPASDPIYVDFVKGKAGYRLVHGGGLKQTIARACGITGKYKPTILDATAGFGYDAFVLASLGCSVTLLERSPIMAALLADGLQRLQQQMKPALRLIQTEAITYVQSLQPPDYPHVIYLDPMYPPRHKSALVKLRMRVLHELVGADQDSMMLAQWALKRIKKRLVIKRPVTAQPLLDQTPDIVYTDKTQRFDVFYPG